MSQLVSIIVPVLNEQKNIPLLVSELKTVFESIQYSPELIFVDDGSTDQSRPIIQELCKAEPWIKSVFFRRNAGQTAAFDAGFRSASGDYIITMDADLQNDPADIPKMLRLLDEGYDFIAGYRANRKDGFILRKFPSRIANWIIRKMTRTSIRDLGCSLKAYRKELSDELRLYGEMHRFIGVLIEAMGARVGQVDTNHRHRKHGNSKYSIWRTFKVVLDLLTVWFLIGFRNKPSYVFGGVGFLMLLAGTCCSLYVLWEKYALDVWVHRNPLFGVGIFFLLGGIQLFGLGLLAEIMIRTYFESSGRVPYQIEKKMGF